MGLETIRDPIIRNNWQKLVDYTHSELMKKGYPDIKFNTFKDNGSYGKAKTGIPSVHWVFALNNREVWIELEIKAKNGQPQESVYNQIHAKSVEIEKKLGYKIRWNKEDLIISSRRETGGDYRIKTVMPFSLDDVRSRKSNTIESWAERMVLFIQVFSPFLPGKDPYRDLTRTSRNQNMTIVLQVGLKNNLSNHFTGKGLHRS